MSSKFFTYSCKYIDYRQFKIVTNFINGGPFTDFPDNLNRNYGFLFHNLRGY